MRKTLFFCLFSVLFTFSFTSAYVITVWTDKDTYRQGQTVYITGRLTDDSGNPIAGVAVAVETVDPDGTTVCLDNPVTNSTGYYNTTCTLSIDATLGNYTVYATYSTAQNTTQFEVIPYGIRIYIDSPLNKTYFQAWVWANITVSENATWCAYSLDGSPNVTMNNDTPKHWYYNLSISIGRHKITFYCNNSQGNYTNNTQYFSRFRPGNRSCYKDGDIVNISVDMDEINMSLYADFSEIDSNFNASNLIVIDNKDTTYIIRYKISSSNTRADGLYNITLNATDYCGNGPVYNTSLDVMLDNTVPIISDCKASPNTTYAGNSVYIYAYVDDLACGVDSSTVRAWAYAPGATANFTDSTYAGPIYLYDDGTHGDSVAHDKNYTGIWDTTSADIKWYAIDILASDCPGNFYKLVNCTQVNITEDTVPPVISIDYPQNNSRVEPYYNVTDDSRYIWLNVTFGEKVDTAWWSNDSGVHNYTLCHECDNGSAKMMEDTWSTDGWRNVTVWANDTRSNVGKRWHRFKVVELTCNDSIDNDGDGLMDCNDTSDCVYNSLNGNPEPRLGPHGFHCCRVDSHCTPNSTIFKCIDICNANATYYQCNLTYTYECGAYNHTEPIRAHPIGEVGVINVSSTWTTVNLRNNYTTPIIVARPASYNEPNSTVTRIRNVGTNSFEIRLQEAPDLDGVHGNETVYYIVVEKGVHYFADGTKIEAGDVVTIQEEPNGGFQSVSFSTSFTDPIVISQVMSYNNASFVKTRERNVGSSGFEVTLEEFESEQTPGSHGSEKIGWIAFERAKGTNRASKYEFNKTSNSVTDSFYTVSFSQTFSKSPVFIATMQTYNDNDPANLRYQSLTSSSVQVKVEEDTTSDSETGHAAEVVGFIAFENIDDIVDNNSKVCNLSATNGTLYNLSVDATISNNCGANCSGGWYSSCYTSLLECNGIGSCDVAGNPSYYEPNIPIPLGEVCKGNSLGSEDSNNWCGAVCTAKDCTFEALDCDGSGGCRSSSGTYVNVPTGAICLGNDIGDANSTIYCGVDCSNALDCTFKALECNVSSGTCANELAADYGPSYYENVTIPRGLVCTNDALGPPTADYYCGIWCSGGEYSDCTFKALACGGTGSCCSNCASQLFYDDFSTFNSTRWTLLGNASYDNLVGRVKLNENLFNVNGALRYDSGINGTQNSKWMINFTFEISGDANADEVDVVFYADNIAANGWYPNNGYAVQYDHWNDDITLFRLSGGSASTLATVAYHFITPGKYYGTVYYYDGQVWVYLNGYKMLYYNITNPDYNYTDFGITARTGGAKAVHFVDDILMNITDAYTVQNITNIQVCTGNALSSPDTSNFCNITCIGAGCTYNASGCIDGSCSSAGTEYNVPLNKFCGSLHYNHTWVDHCDDAGHCDNDGVPGYPTCTISASNDLSGYDGGGDASDGGRFVDYFVDTASPYPVDNVSIGRLSFSIHPDFDECAYLGAGYKADAGQIEVWIDGNNISRFWTSLNYWRNVSYDVTDIMNHKVDTFVAIYNDSDYGSCGIANSYAIEVANTVYKNLTAYGIPALGVNASGLSEYMSNHPKGIAVITRGCLPDTTQSGCVDATQAETWLEGGGTIIFVGYFPFFEICSSGSGCVGATCGTNFHMNVFDLTGTTNLFITSAHYETITHAGSIYMPSSVNYTSSYPANLTILEDNSRSFEIYGYNSADDVAEPLLIKVGGNTISDGNFIAVNLSAISTTQDAQRTGMMIAELIKNHIYEKRVGRTYHITMRWRRGEDMVAIRNVNLSAEYRDARRRVIHYPTPNDAPSTSNTCLENCLPGIQLYGCDGSGGISGTAYDTIFGTICSTNYACSGGSCASTDAEDDDTECSSATDEDCDGLINCYEHWQNDDCYNNICDTNSRCLGPATPYNKCLKLNYYGTSAPSCNWDYDTAGCTYSENNDDDGDNCIGCLDYTTAPYGVCDTGSDQVCASGSETNTIIRSSGTAGNYIFVTAIQEDGPWLGTEREYGDNTVTVCLTPNTFVKCWIRDSATVYMNRECSGNDDCGNNRLRWNDSAGTWYTVHNPNSGCSGSSVANPCGGGAPCTCTGGWSWVTDTLTPPSNRYVDCLEFYTHFNTRAPDTGAAGGAYLYVNYLRCYDPERGIVDIDLSKPATGYPVRSISATSNNLPSWTNSFE